MSMKVIALLILVGFTSAKNMGSLEGKGDNMMKNNIDSVSEYSDDDSTPEVKDTRTGVKVLLNPKIGQEEDSLSVGTKKYGHMYRRPRKDEHANLFRRLWTTESPVNKVGRTWSPEQRKRQSKKLKAYWNSLSRDHERKKWSEERKQAHSQFMKEYWAKKKLRGVVKMNK